jgi:hypothetical protein
MSHMSDRDAARQEAMLTGRRRAAGVRTNEKRVCQDLSVPELVDVLIARRRNSNGFEFLTYRQRANLLLALLGNETQ